MCMKLLNLFHASLCLVIFRKRVHFGIVYFQPIRAGKGKNEKCTLWSKKKTVRERRERGERDK